MIAFAPSHPLCGPNAPRLAAHHFSFHLTLHQHPLARPAPNPHHSTTPPHLYSHPACPPPRTHARAQNRQLGYVTVTRPVRQGRLKLALEEVLMMQLDGGVAAHHQVCVGGGGLQGCLEKRYRMH